METTAAAVPELLDRGEMPALMQISRAELDTMIVTAKRFPRTISRFRSQLREMATMDEETAASMFYVIPRAGKRIEGPSIRLAELCLSCWGNIRFGTRIIETAERHVTAQGAVYDLENNVWGVIEEQRRITNREGHRYDDDMISVTKKAAQSIALRGATWKVIPFAHVKAIYEDAKRVAVGQGLSLEKSRANALTWFSRVGASEGDVLKLLQRPAVVDITLDDVVDLRGLRTAIQDGETTWDDILRDVKAASGGDNLLDKLQESLRVRREGAGRSHGEAASGADERAGVGTPAAVDTRAESGAPADEPRQGPDSDKVEAEVTVPAPPIPLKEMTIPIPSGPPTPGPLRVPLAPIAEAITADAHRELALEIGKLGLERKLKDAVLQFICKQKAGTTDFAAMSLEALRLVRDEVKRIPVPGRKQ